MIKANELRIGNAILMFSKGMNEYEEVTISAQHILNIEKGLAKTKPIPLTEEWLKKFGFREAGNYLYLNYPIEYPTQRIFIFHKADVSLYFEHGEYRIEIKYAHQLQNLYFALTSEELTIK